MKPTAPSDWRNRPVERTCTKCDATFTGKYNSTTCPPCKTKIRAAVHARFRENNPDYWVEWNKSGAGQHSRRVSKLNGYGLTIKEHNAMIAAQRGVCAICGAEPGTWVANCGRLVIDHDHSTGEVRGLLCPSCNRGLGQFEDDPIRLTNAAAYLSR